MKHLLFFSVILLSPHIVSAQDNYVPPPMFDAPAMNAQQGENIMRRFSPRYSSRQQPQKPDNATAPEQKYRGANNPLLPPVVTQGDPALEPEKPVISPAAPQAPKLVETAKAPLPAIKPQISQAARPQTQAPGAPIVAAPIPPPVEKPQAPVIAAPAAPPEPDAMPAARVTSKGVVTGPKTMPSVPTGDVVAVNTFNEDSGTDDGQPTLMERHQAAAQEDEPAPAPAPVAVIQHIAAAPAQPSDKLTIPFTRGIAEINDPSVDGIVSALQSDPAARLMIEAYGTSVDQGEHSDRRLSLARAMSVRRVIMEEGIAPHRIDIRALGRHVPDGSPERVDLSVYKS